MNTAGFTGRRGEQQAERYLCRCGWSIAGRNFRTRQGELDLIAQKGNMIAFVEVKTRASRRFAAACEFVTPAKQRRLIAAALVWLQKYPTRLQPRFDVIEVYWPQAAPEPTEIRHIEGAFEA